MNRHALLGALDSVFETMVLFGTTTTTGEVRTDQTCGLQARGGGVDSPHPSHRLVVVYEPLATDGHLGGIGDQVLFTGIIIEKNSK